MQFTNNVPINNVGIFNTNSNTLHINTINTATPAAPQNIIFEFYFHLPNDTRIYHVTYSELNTSENVQLLNSGINLSHIHDYQFPYHYNIQYLIQQLIQQRVQQPIDYHIQQSFDTMGTSQMYDDMQYTGYDRVNHWSSPKN